MLPPRCCLPCTHDFFFPAWVRNPGGRAVWRRQSARHHASAGNFLCFPFSQNKFWLPGVLRWAEGQEVGWSNPHLSQGPPSSGSYLVLSKWLMSTSAPCLQEFQMLCKQCVLCISLIICLRYSGTKHQGPWYGLQLNSPYSGSWS